MDKRKKIDSFFKRKVNEKEKNDIASATSPPKERHENPRIKQEEPPSKIPKVTSSEFDVKSLERGLANYLPIWEYPINQRDEIRRTYLKCGPY